MTGEKPQPITAEIKSALLAMKVVHMTNEAVGRILGVSKVTVGKYLSGETDTIRKDNWKAMEPHLRPYLRQPDPHKLSAETSAIAQEMADRAGMEVGPYLDMLVRQEHENMKRYQSND